MAAKVSEVERFEGADFGAGHEAVFAGEAQDLRDLDLGDGNLRDVPGMGCLQFGEPMRELAFRCRQTLRPSSKYPRPGLIGTAPAESNVRQNDALRLRKPGIECQQCE